MINGIPIRIKTANEKGDLTNIETFMFATFRKCPELAKYPKEIAQLENKTKVMRKKLELAEERLDSAVNDEEAEAAGEIIGKINDDMIGMNEKILDLFAKFVRHGLAAAGYTEDQVEKYACHVTMDRLPELFGKARLGAGVCDFF